MRFLAINICLLFLGISGIYAASKSVVAPDVLACSRDGKTLWVGNRFSAELLKVDSRTFTVKKRVVLDAPVTVINPMSDGTLWVASDGVCGKIYKMNGENLKILSSFDSGYSPSSLLLNRSENTAWVTLRYNNEIWKLDLDKGTLICKVSVGREPVGAVSFADGRRILVVNNMPEMSALDYPVAAQMDIVDTEKNKVVKRLLLPNGTTDVKSVATDVTGTYAYVTHLLARYQLPTNQVDRGWMYTNALTVVDLKNEKIETTVLLDTPQKGAANPWQVIVSPDNKEIYVALSGVHEVCCIDRNKLHARLEKAKQGVSVTPSYTGWKNVMNDTGMLYGVARYLPAGVKGTRAIAVSGETLYAAGYFTGDISIAENGIFNVQQKLGENIQVTAEGRGNMYFHDATLGFQGWQSCASCHPNDGRADGLNWDLLNDGLGNPKNTKSLLLSYQTPPCMITGIRKNAEVAVRSGIKYILFAVVPDAVAEDMDAYLRALKPLPSPYLQDGVLSEKAVRGKIVFDKDCLSCHSGSYFTNGKLYPVDWASGTEAGKKMDVPALIEIWRTAPYLYDGRCSTMKDMLKVHGPREKVSKEEIEELEEYILSL
ncbi:cell surface protein [Coprobacter sp.]